MPFLGPSMSTTMLGLMTSKGMVGQSSPDLASAAGIGSQLSIVGKPFTTTDVGTVPGVGVGVGVGLTIPPALIQATVLQAAAAAGFTGPRLTDLAQAFADALSAECAKITLTSSHSPVFAGTGTVVPGSIPVVAPEWGGNITSQGVSKGFLGQSWPQLAEAFSKGGVAGFGVAVGTVTITGSPTSAITSPGTGSGSGALS